MQIFWSFMLNAKIFIVASGLFIFCMTFGVDAVWFGREKEKIELLEKPQFFHQDKYKDGTLVQFTVDRDAFLLANVTGISVRTLVALAQCGTKFENFKSSVLRPGAVKSVLFWAPAFGVYRYVLAVKSNDELLHRLSEKIKKQSKEDQNPWEN